MKIAEKLKEYIVEASTLPSHQLVVKIQDITRIIEELESDELIEEENYTEEKE